VWNGVPTPLAFSTILLENLDAISARYAICFFAANIVVEQEFTAAAIMIALFALTRFWYTSAISTRTLLVEYSR